jgi:glycosyltransferase involved in cell wall biosynthesis
LPEAVDSILAQTFADFELVLCDNASTDGTEELCRQYAATDCRVRYHRNRRNIGVAANFDLSSALCTATLVKWAASDDVLGPTCLEDCIEVLDHNPGVVLAVPRGRLIDSSSFINACGGLRERSSESTDPPVRGAVAIYALKFLSAAWRSYTTGP